VRGQPANITIYPVLDFVVDVSMCALSGSHRELRHTKALMMNPLVS